MATGASTCDLAVILVDARNGIVLPQTRRHAFICSLLGIRQLVLAVNKMDLVGFDERRFAEIAAGFAAFAAGLGEAAVHAIPLSALSGDNVIRRSERMPWYRGPSLLEHLESVEVTGGGRAAVPFSGAMGQSPERVDSAASPGRSFRARSRPATRYCSPARADRPGSARSSPSTARSIAPAPATR